jgi:hypothetical protein
MVDPLAKVLTVLLDQIFQNLDVLLSCFSIKVRFESNVISFDRLTVLVVLKRNYSAGDDSGDGPGKLKRPYMKSGGFGQKLDSYPSSDLTVDKLKAHGRTSDLKPVKKTLQNSQVVWGKFEKRKKFLNWLSDPT